MRRILAILTPLLGLFFFSWAQTFFSAAAVVAVPACSNSDAGGIIPITGIEVLSDTLTAGLGCGTGPDQIFKYAAVVTIPTDAGVTGGLAGAYIAGSVTDCFANATFVSLCTYGASESSTYDVTVYAFNQAEWNQTAPVGEDAGVPEDASTPDAAPDASATDAAASDASPSDAAAGDASPSDASAPEAGLVFPDAAAPGGTPGVSGATLTAGIGTANNNAAAVNNPANNNNLNTCGVTANQDILLSELGASAGWVAHCIATQQSNIPVIANCGPLVPTGL